MSIQPFQALACPLDGAPLRRRDGTWRCPSGHNFDIASQGYTHLLPVQQKRSRDPGDSKEMVSARRRFLNAGFYQPIAAAVSRAALSPPEAATSQPADTILSILDAGCGEGYYLRQLAAEDNDQHSLALLGLDISKWAVLAAAKQDRADFKGKEANEDTTGRMNWVVGSNAKLPVQPGSLDRVLCLFGFPVYAEFARVLKPGGLLLQVDAGPDHLRELREIIYPAIKPENTSETPPPAGFKQLSTTTIRYPIDLVTSAQINDLLIMTPHFFRATADGRARANGMTSIALTVDVRLSCFERTPKQ
ncbi:MAG: methyltransferase domain-containing protein [Zoogloeaceae bacterium]|nr:methyltransferase domain-containing protein [Zoogloeaceae bacterium]